MNFVVVKHVRIKRVVCKMTENLPSILSCLNTMHILKLEQVCLSYLFGDGLLTNDDVGIDQGPVVQSIISLTSSLRVISLTVLADSIHNILIFFAEKM